MPSVVADFRRPPSAGAALRDLPIGGALQNNGAVGAAAPIAANKAILRLAQLLPAMRELAIFAAPIIPFGKEVAEHHLMRLLLLRVELLVVGLLEISFTVSEGATTPALTAFMAVKVNAPPADPWHLTLQ